MKIAALVEVPHPAEFIKDELVSRGLSQRELVKNLGIEDKLIDEIMSCKKGISPVVAKMLSKAFGIQAEYFFKLQKAYELSKSQDQPS